MIIRFLSIAMILGMFLVLALTACSHGTISPEQRQEAERSWKERKTQEEVDRAIRPHIIIPHNLPKK